MSRQTADVGCQTTVEVACQTTVEAACQTDGPIGNSKCEICKGNGRNLILCFDGTSNQFGENNTNVIELYSRIIKDDTQLTYYNSGIGTYARPSWRSYTYWKQVLDSTIDLGIAWNFESVILAGYRWLSDNYIDGDKIFLFGFSRGAYQARVLAGMIDKVGLILRGNEEQIPFAYELYADISKDFAVPRDESKSKSPQKGPIKMDDRSGKKEDKSQEKDQSSQSPEDDSNMIDKSTIMAKRFKVTFSRPNVRVHFIGVWDTVSSVGVVRGKSLPGTNNFDPNNICYFRHALALDERRVKFLPEYVCGGDSYVDKGGSATARVKEVWFAGCHSDIGGGNEKNAELNNAAIPVLWMGNEALFAGLKLEASKVVWDWEKLAITRPQESLVHIWYLFELFPFKRLSYDKWVHTWWPNVGKGRVIKPGQKIHASVSFIKDYKPNAEFSPEMVGLGKNWRSIVGKGKKDDVSWTKGNEDILELDLFDYSNVKKIIENGDLDRLAFIALTREGRQAIASADPELMIMLKMLEDSDETKFGVGVVMLSTLATYDAAKSAAMKTDFIQRLARTTTSKNIGAATGCIGLIRELLKYDDIRGKLNQEGIASLLASVVKDGDKRATEASRALHEYVRHSDGREAFLKMADNESSFEWLPKCGAWHLLIVSELCTHDGDPRLSLFKDFQLLTALQRSTDLLSDERNANGVCRLIEHDLFEKSTANDVIRHIINTIGPQMIYGPNVLSAFFKHPEVRKKIPEDLIDHCIVSLRKMIDERNYYKRYIALQALYICAGCSEIRKKILKSETTQLVLDLFNFNNDADKYYASRVLIALSGGDQQPRIPTKDIIAWLIDTVGYVWRYRQTVKFLSEIVQNDHHRVLMNSVNGIRNLDMLNHLPSSISSTKTFFMPPKGREEELEREFFFFRFELEEFEGLPKEEVCNFIV